MTTPTKSYSSLQMLSGFLLLLGFSFLLNTFIHWSSLAEKDSPELAAVATSLDDSRSLGSFAIRNGSSHTPITITGFSLNPPLLNSLSFSDFNDLFWNDRLYELANPVSISPGDSYSLSIYIDLANTPASLFGQPLSLSSVHYKTGQGEFEASASVSFTIPVKTPPLVSSSSINTNNLNLSACVPTAAICDPDMRQKNSDIIKRLSSASFSENTIVTYVPTSPDNWRSVANNVRLGDSYQSIAADFPDILKPEVIKVPANLNISNTDSAYTCSVGLNGEINRLESLLVKQRLLSLAISQGLNLPELNLPKIDSCVSAPSYAGGTFKDVSYYLPAGECLTDIRASLTEQFNKTRTEVNDLKLSFFKNGQVNEKVLDKDTREKLTPADKLNNFHSSIKSCRDFSEQNGLDEAEASNLKIMYGQACQEAKTVYPQFNHATDAPTVANSYITTKITKLKTTDINGCAERRIFTKNVLNKKTGKDEHIRDNWCIEEYKLEIDGKSCIGPNSLENCGYTLIPIENPMSITPTGYFKIGPENTRIGGACTGISNLVDYFFSNGHYVGGDNYQKLSEFPNRLENQCFEIESLNFKNWFEEQFREIDKYDYESDDSYGSAVWEKVMDDVPDVCELITPLDFPSSLIFELGFDNISNTFISGLREMNINENENENDNINENLYNNIDDPFSVLKNRHYDILDDLISGHTSSLSLVATPGAHQIFGYSCNSDTSINSFDPNIPSKSVKIYPKENGLWRIPAWKFLGSDFSNLNTCIKEQMKGFINPSDEILEAIKKSCLAEERVGENVLITVNRSMYQQLGQCR